MALSKKKRFFLAGVLIPLTAAAAAGLAILLMQKTGWGIPCLFNRLTGLRCPGCGNTRAVQLLLSGDAAGAFRQNAMLLPQLGYLAFVYLISAVSYIKTGKFTYRSPCKALDIILLAALLIWFPLRNFLHI